MRARNIKPIFFKDEDLAEMGACGQILFAGLWALADRDGKLEDRLKRIKAEIFPYYNPKPEVDKLLDALAQRKLIVRYTVNGCNYIKIHDFLKYQKPHDNETASVIPEPLSPMTASPSLHGEKSCQPSKEAFRPDSLIPDSLNDDSLNPESLDSEKDMSSPSTPAGGTGAAPSYPVLTVNGLVKIWNEAAPAYFPRVIIPLGAKRKKKIAANMNIDRPDPELYWSKLFQDIDRDDFYSGRSGKWTGLDFDWAVINHEKLRSKLDRTISRPPRGTGRTAGNVEAARKVYEKLRKQGPGESGGGDIPL